MGSTGCNRRSNRRCSRLWSKYHRNLDESNEYSSDSNIYGYANSRSMSGSDLHSNCNCESYSSGHEYDFNDLQYSDFHCDTGERYKRSGSCRYYLFMGSTGCNRRSNRRGSRNRSKCHRNLDKPYKYTSNGDIYGYTDSRRMSGGDVYSNGDDQSCTCSY
jgi:hypothetical protein